ncbi:VIT family protein [Neisseria sp. CCUG12390]|uniref:VIT1/CCC1 transporter family protein n=1 Tax=Neisseria sp. CCUG12390 TaxID=3392035 RepID=UPI003A1013E4
MYTRHAEPHFSTRSNWLRAAVLGANDGLISTAALLTGMAAAKPDFPTLLLTGIAALVGGAVSMAAGEYVSVSSQADTEKADLQKERRELAAHPEAELDELATIYEMRGLEPQLARQVAEALTRRDALSAHARDEIGITEARAAKPLQAALASAAAFSAGAVLPLAVALLMPSENLMAALAASTLLGLAALGWLSARLGGAKPLRAVVRVVAWGVLALGITAVIGRFFGAAV